MSGEDEFCREICQTPGMRYDTVDRCTSVCKQGGCGMCSPGTQCANLCAEHRGKVPQSRAMAIPKPGKTELIYLGTGIALGALIVGLVVKSRA